MALPNGSNILDIRVPVAVNPESVIFQFVNVRSPGMAGNGAPLQGVISYLQNSSAFVSELTKLSNNQDPDVSAQRGQLQKLTESHIRSVEFVAAKQALLVDLSSLVRFGRWLWQMQAIITSTSVEQAIAETNCKPVDKERLIKIWEALIGDAIAGAASAERADFLAVLRAQYFLENQAATGGNVALLRQLASVEIVLPGNLFPLPQTRPARQARPEQTSNLEAARELTARAEKLAAYEHALAELRNLAEVRLEEARNTPQPLARIPPDSAEPTPEYDKKVQTLAAAYRRMDFIEAPSVLSPETQKIIAGIGSIEKFKISFIIRQLEQSAVQLSREAGLSSLAYQQVFQAGSALWMQPLPAEPAQSGSDSATRLETNLTGSDLYDKFYTGNRAVTIRPLSIADLNRVEQTLICYKAGEVAHIENVLQGELKERSTRRQRCTGQTCNTTPENEQMQEQEAFYTGRYELARETSFVLNQNDAHTDGVSASRNFGPVRVEASANFVTSSSPIESDRQTSSYAKNITDRSLQHIVERVRDQRTLKLLEEYEENNKHSLDNRAGTKHMAGVYRWVDKIYKAQVVNYGKRLMFEFMIPEPGSFHLWAMSRSVSRPNGSLTLPPDPRTLDDPLKTHHDITLVNYAGWAAIYGAGVAPPPGNIRVAKSLTSSKDLVDDVSEKQWTGSFDIDIPSGYVAESASVIVTVQDAYDFAPGVLFFIGNTASWVSSDKTDRKNQIDINYPLHADMVEKVPFSYWVKYSDFFLCNIEILCKPSSSNWEEWKIKTFHAVMQAYQAKKDAYDKAIAEVQASSSLNQIQGIPSAINQTIIFDELKKGCIYWLCDGQDFSNNALSGYDDPVNPPEVDTQPFKVAGLERAKFIEQCFEWSLMTYTLYPYFWAGKWESPGKSRWRYLYQLSDSDPLFLRFLQSGMARVHVPVRPGYEKAAMYFLRTGDIWNGGDVPGIESPVYISIVEELKSGTETTLVGDTWEIRVPSTLTILQADSGVIEDKGLPTGREPMKTIQD